jgi:hypothetical protein
MSVTAPSAGSEGSAGGTGGVARSSLEALLAPSPPQASSNIEAHTLPRASLYFESKRPFFEI